MPKRGIVLMGQSNGFSGYAEDRVDAFKTHPNLWQFKNDGTYQNAPVQPMDFQNLGNANRKFVSYVYYLIRDYLIPANPGVDYCILPQSVGGSGFSLYWHAPSAALNASVGVTGAGVNQFPLGGTYYEKTITQINAFLAMETGNTIDAVFLQNGEQETGDATSVFSSSTGIGYYHDSFGLTNRQAYTRYVTEMITDMAARTGTRTWPFLIGQPPPDLAYPQSLVGPSSDGLEHSNATYIPFMDAIAAMPANVTNCAYLDSLNPIKVMCHTGVMSDGNDDFHQDGSGNPVPGGDGIPDVIMNSGNYWLHTCQAGHHVMADKAFRAYTKLKGNGFPISFSYTAPATVTPSTPSLDLVTASDTGSSSADNITSITTPDISVTCVTNVLAGDVIRLRDGATLLVSHTVTAEEIGTLAFALGLTALSDGAHSLTAAHERDGLVSAYSTALVVTIDTTAPGITTPSTANVNEGVALALPLTANETVTWTKTADVGNNFEISGTTLRWTSNGTKTFTGVVDAYTCQVTATDVAGNLANKSITVTVLDVVATTTRSFGAEGIGVTGAIGGRDFGAEGIGFTGS